MKDQSLKEAITLDEKRKSILEEIDETIKNWEKLTLKDKDKFLKLIKFDVRFLKSEQLKIVKETLEKVGIMPSEKFDEFVKEGYEIDGIEPTIKTEAQRKWITGLELIEQPIIEPPSPIGKGFLVPERYTILAAKDGEGKTTLLTQLTLCSITGIPFLGIWPIPKPVKVLYFCGENSRGDIKAKISKQIPEIEKVLNRKIKEDLKLRLRIIEPQNINFFLDQRIAESITGLYEYLEQIKPDIVIFDPLSNFIGSSKSINDDTIARATAKRLNQIAREFNCFPILTSHFKKESKDQPENIFEMFHGSRYWINASISQIALKPGGLTQGANLKKIHIKFKTEPENPKPFQVLFDRETLWYNESKDQDEITRKAKLRSKDIAEVLKRLCEGHSTPMIFYEIARKELNVSDKQIRQLTRLAIAEGLIEKGKYEFEIMRAVRQEKLFDSNDKG